ncbi:ribonuclease H family protein [Pseudoalteromonas sp. MMG005]|uniref:ribonuclease H family protein n=1 Tax=Pseudoalteromonas sp. MMG005 TaxID=2822682 RepID=UPI0032B3B5FA
MTLAKKFYVVWQGREPGIYTNWAQCKAQVDGFSGAKYKSFSSQEEAESAFGGRSFPQREIQDISSKITKKKPSALSQAHIDQMAYDIKIYTDGGCEPNPGEAGTGLAVYENDVLSELWYGLYQSIGTNNTAELRGLNQALLIAQDKLSTGKSVVIYCDSKYSIDCITKWASNWEKKGWTKASGEIKNLDIIQPAYALYQTLLSKIAIYHVNGHVGIEGNELADRMSILAIDSKDEGLCRYNKNVDIPTILAMRTG